MKEIKDIIVIGAGPVGSYTAYQLAKAGIDVSVIEEHPIPGEPASCTGVIGTKAFDEFDLPKESILNKVKNIKFISPSGNEYLYEPEATQAFVVDRRMFDYKLMRQAQKKGAEYILGTRVSDINLMKNCVELDVKSAEGEHKVKTKVAVIATGYNYKLTKKLGLGQPPRFLNGAQIETKAADIEQTEIYFGSHVAPGSFAWAVPLNNKQARIGLTTDNDAAFYLRRMLKSKYFTKRVIDGENAKIILDNIALGTIPKSFLARILVVGEAAGQVKSTTNGGVLYGLCCSKIAAEVIKKAFKSSNFSEKLFSEYEKKWQRKYGLEIKIGYYFRKIVSELSDAQIDKLFEISKGPTVINTLKKKSNFDMHKDLVLFLLKNKTYRDIVWQGFWETLDFRR